VTTYARGSTRSRLMTSERRALCAFYRSSDGTSQSKLGDKMKKFLWLAAPLTSLLFIGCGSSDEDKDSANDEGSGSGAMGDLDVDGIDGGEAGEASDGGTVPLTEDEYDAIASAACADQTAQGEPLPAVLQLVVDVSGSMNDGPDGEEIENGNDQPSKWDITQEALAAAIADLPDNTSVGILYYGTGDDSECVSEDMLVPISSLDGDQRDAIDSSLEQIDPAGSTPTHDAYNLALESSLLESESSNRFMLLITDGAPTVAEGCEGGGRGSSAPTQPIIDSIGAAADDHSVKTFVIGSPGSETSGDGDDLRPWLSEAAEAGGTAKSDCDNEGPEFCHLDMTQEPDFGAALQAGLSEIVGSIASGCTFTIPDAPDNETLNISQTNLVITSGAGDSTLILQDEVGECTEGWQINDAGEIELCSETCDAVLEDEEAAILLTFGCATEDIIPVR